MWSHRSWGDVGAGLEMPGPSPGPNLGVLLARVLSMGKVETHRELFSVQVGGCFIQQRAFWFGFSP